MFTARLTHVLFSLWWSPGSQTPTETSDSWARIGWAGNLGDTNTDWTYTTHQLPCMCELLSALNETMLHKASINKTSRSSQRSHTVTYLWFPLLSWSIPASLAPWVGCCSEGPWNNQSNRSHTFNQSLYSLSIKNYLSEAADCSWEIIGCSFHMLIRPFQRCKYNEHNKNKNNCINGSGIKRI